MKNLSLELVKEIKTKFTLEYQEPFLLFLAIINNFLEKRKLGRVIIVGGYAVELYSGSGYTTGDIDIIVENNADIVRDALDIIAPRDTRVWFLEKLGLVAKAIDIVGTLYNKPKKPMVLQVEKMAVYIEPPEETIISCLNACVYWKSDLDCEKAAMVISAQKNKLDWNYLHKRARQEDIESKLLEIKKFIE